MRHEGGALFFRVRDRTDNTSVPVRYTGEVPDPFREGREVIVDVQKQGSVFVGQKDSLVTKCPSKFKAAHPLNGDPRPCLPDHRAGARALRRRGLDLRRAGAQQAWIESGRRAVYAMSAWWRSRS